MRTSPWLNPGPKPHTGQLRLFCFTYAGGGARAYQGWSLPPLPRRSIEILTVVLPGRHPHRDLPSFVRIPQLVDALVGALAPHLTQPFAFFGHSLGALVAFELTRALARKPLHLFVSGARAPRLGPKPPIIHALPDRELIEELRGYGATPEQVLANAELMELLLPMLRADFELGETYAYRPATLLSCPITALGGTADEEVSRDELAAWQEETSGPFDLEQFEGGHFYIDSAREPLLARLTRVLHTL